VFLIANTMNTLMAEQTAEIGIMKAIGGRRRQIAGVYLRAALYLALFGVVVGVPVGIVLAHLIAGFVTSSVLGVPGRFAVSISVIAFSALFAVVLTMAASAPALRRALHIPVREALQSQGAAVTFGMSPLDRLLVRERVLPQTMRFGARNLVRNKRRTAATTGRKISDGSIRAVRPLRSSDWLLFARPRRPPGARALRGVTLA
jgi:putative ABC transport system permease protein